MISKEQLDNWFTYHPPLGGQPERYEQLRAAGRKMAETIVRLTPASADQTDAVRKVREAVMTANAAIACDNTPRPGERSDGEPAPGMAATAPGPADPPRPAGDRPRA